MVANKDSTYGGRDAIAGSAYPEKYHKFVNDSGIHQLFDVLDQIPNWSALMRTFAPLVEQCANGDIPTACLQNTTGKSGGQLRATSQVTARSGTS